MNEGRTWKVRTPSSNTGLTGWADSGGLSGFPWRVRWWRGGSTRGDPGMVWLGESGRSEGDTRPLVTRLNTGVVRHY
jgi:hypothetical protein